MATIVHKRINGYGPYAYRVTYGGGQHHWEYLGKAGEVDTSPGPVTTTRQEDRDAGADGDGTDDDHTDPDTGGAATTHADAPRDRAHYEGTLDRILDGESYGGADDWYDSEARWAVDQITEHYHEHDIRVSLTNIDDMDRLRDTVADIEELRDAGVLDGIHKITTTPGENLAEKHGGVSGVNAEYEPEPQDIVGNSLGYQPTITLNGDTYRDGDDGSVTSYGTDIEDTRHALWHEAAHHVHLREYHDADVDIESVMDANDGGVWDRMHASMDPYRDAIGEEFGQGLDHDPIEFYAEARSRDMRGEDLPTDVHDAMHAVEADNILTE
ncbi:hypothetical protein HLRTI_001345 [Halorhabdus tiamatea SARL4B]|uniref:Uncharacterized protein n=1 Tax=Halorhabdus tiamatea SARL4B TaxID=1033806 RepID=F7PI44_9EURY|nr:hypothetical protein [Halorhabdus tiamatea]ERJ06639.1 hypothetical protein HLRTI_001345 [Halorhabdus tiamatea SARL4B]CCQ32210.1 hypothetical protein HTIA_0059 [Halorhabdus tiamatea SARL4B]